VTHDLETPPRPRVGRPRLHPSPAEQPREVARLLTDEGRIACQAHIITAARNAEAAATAERERVEAEALAAGFHVEAWVRAMDLLNADPDQLLELERHVSVVMLAVKAATTIEAAMIETITDQSVEARADRIRAEGYAASVLDRQGDVDSYSAAEDRAVWVAGWHDFRRDLAAFEAEQAVANVGAFCPHAPSDTLHVPNTGGPQ
jgi:ribosome modulation factor